MATYIYSVKTVKYGTPTGTNTMPATGAMTALPNTVKGSVSIEESDGASQKFEVDQQIVPIMVVKTEEGTMTAKMQFYDCDFATMAALKGGVGNASGWTPATGYTNVLKAMEITTDSGHKFNFFNAQLATKIVGGGGRDQMFKLDVTATPLMSTDVAGSIEIKPI